MPRINPGLFFSLQSFSRNYICDMNEFFAKIIPVILVFCLGIFLKQIKLLKKEDGDLFLKLVFSVCFPALSFAKIMELQLTTDLIFIPIAAWLTILITAVVSYLMVRPIKLPKPTQGTFLIGAMIMNTGFTLPFFFAGYGNEGLAKAALFDVANCFLIFTFIYFVAVRHSENVTTHAKMFKKFIYMPPLWAMAAGLLLKSFNVALPSAAVNILDIVGEPSIFLIMLSLGLYFQPKLKNLKNVIIVIVLRMGLGLALGIFFCLVFHLEGVSRIVVLASCAAPVGYNTLVFSSLENLDKEFAATLISFSILIGIVYIPLIFYIFGKM